MGVPPVLPGSPRMHRSAALYDRADGPARARGKVLPWDKKLTLANGKFTACIFIFLIPVPSASNRCPASPAFYLQDAAWQDLGLLLAREPRLPMQRPMGSPGESPGSHHPLDGSHPFHEAPQETGTSEEGLKQRQCPWSWTVPAPLGWLRHVLRHRGRSTKTQVQGFRPPLPTPGFRVISAGDPTCRCREGRPVPSRAQHLPFSPTVILSLSSKLLKFTYI